MKLIQLKKKQWGKNEKLWENQIYNYDDIAVNEIISI